MDRRSRTPLVWIAAALITSASGQASAQKAAAPAASAREKAAPSAKDLYAAAQKLFDKGSYAEALVAFRQAYNASSSPNARLMIGHCLVALGKTAEAYEEMSATMREAAKRAETEAKYAPTRDTAATQVALLEPKVGKVIVDVPDPSATEVLVNGTRVEASKLGAPLAVEPGSIVVTATSADGRRARGERTVKAGEMERISLKFDDAPGAGAEAAGPAEVQKNTKNDPQNPVELKASTGGGARAAGFVVLGLGAAGMAAFGITGSMAKGRFSTLEDECGGARCTDPKYADVIDSGKTLTTLANVSLLVGAAGLVGGALMITLGGPSVSGAPAPKAALSIAPGRAGFVVSGTF